MSGQVDRELLEVPDREALHEWLSRNHESSLGVHLAVSRKDGKATALTYEDAVLEGLAFGWIDSTTHKLDDDRMSILFTRRKPTSTWSQSNKERVARLTNEGRMMPAGIAAVEVAKRNGSWTLLDDVDALVMPPELSEALVRAKATEAWNAASVSQRKMALYWISSAKRSETRQSRLEQVVEAARTGRPLR